MASIDGGHYFLTALIPVRRAWVTSQHHQTTAPIILLREKLAQMPTAMQTPKTTEGNRISKFSASTRTHFARFAVIDRLGYNGYVAVDPVLSTLGLARPTEQREELERPYLLFAAEFDAPSGSPTYDLAVYLRELWDVMNDDLIEIFENCVDFEPSKITTAADFINYIKPCVIETTMPFNYYWAEAPQLETLTAKGLMIGAVLLALTLGGISWWALHSRFPILAVIIGVLVGLASAVAFAAIRIKSVGDRRFPTAPDSDLLSVLKALHLQTTFGRFVIDNQLAGAGQLHAAFGEYLLKNRPREPEPKHPAGRVVR